MFFPSYSYEQKVFERWQAQGMSHAISQIKTVLRESKDKTAEEILGQYAEALRGELTFANFFD